MKLLRNEMKKKRDDSTIIIINDEIIRQIPKSLWVSMVTTFVIGLVSHGMAYGEFIYWGDGLNIYNSKRSLSLVASATGFRWLQSFTTFFFQFSMPWVGGIFLLLCFGLGSWFAARTLGITSRVKVAVLAALMITSYTAIAISSCPGMGYFNFGMAYLCASLGAYFYICRAKLRYLGLAFFTFIAVGIYPPYISWTISLILVESMTRLMGKVDVKEEFIKQIKCLAIAGCVLALDIIVCIIIVDANADAWLDKVGRSRITMVSSIGDDVAASRVKVSNVMDSIVSSMDYRLRDDVARPFFDIIADMVDSGAIQARRFFVPGGDDKESYFDKNLACYAFYVGALFSIVIILYRLWCRRKSLRISAIILIACDFVVLPYSINVIGMLESSHELMRIAFMIPWIIMLCLVDSELENVNYLEVVYHYTISIVLVCQILWGVYLANVCYTKAKIIYQSQLFVASRVIDRVEQIEGYEKGVTPVVFWGKLKEYAQPIKAFAVTDTMFGYVTPANDSAALDSASTYITLMNQQLNNNVKAQWIGNDRDVPDGEIGQYLRGEADSMNQFPATDCAKWVGDDTLILVKLSELE